MGAIARNIKPLGDCNDGLVASQSSLSNTAGGAHHSRFRLPSMMPFWLPNDFARPPKKGLMLYFTNQVIHLPSEYRVPYLPTLKQKRRGQF